MGDISKNFSWSEFTATSHAELQDKNAIPSVEVRDSIRELVQTVLQPLRDLWGYPLKINSGYRCKELNEAVGGAPTSQHLKGEAADVGVDEPRDLAVVAKITQLPFDQMILYPTFVHFSHRKGGPQRGQILYSKTYTGVKL